MRSLVRQHRLAGHVTDGVNQGIIRLQLLIHLNKSALADLYPSFFEAGNLGIRLASHRDENLVENFFLLFNLRAIEGDADSSILVFHRRNGRVQENRIENLFDAFV